MSDYTPQVGHRVRVVLEGVVSGTFQYGDRGVILNGRILSHSDVETWNATFERLPDPEPEWQPGDVVLDAAGVVWSRVGEEPDFPWGRFRINEPFGRVEYKYVNFYGDDPSGPRRPLTPLARDGKPWAQAVDGAQ